MLDAKEQVGERRMNDDCGETIEIVEREGSFLLIRAALRFAVVAQRASRASPMKPGERDGKPLTPEGLAAPVAEEGWLSEDEAQRQLREVCERSAIASVTQFNNL